MTDMIERQATVNAILKGMLIGVPEEERGAAALVNQALVAAMDRVKALRPAPKAPDPYRGARRLPRHVADGGD